MSTFGQKRDDLSQLRRKAPGVDLFAVAAKMFPGIPEAIEAEFLAKKGNEKDPSASSTLSFPKYVGARPFRPAD